MSMSDTDTGTSSLRNSGTLLDNLIRLGMADRKLRRRIEMNRDANGGKQLPCPLSATPDPSRYFANAESEPSEDENKTPLTTG